MTRWFLLGLAAAGGFLLVPQAPAFAGANSAELSCSAGDVRLSGTIPRDIVELDLTFENGEGAALRWATPSALVMVDHVSDRVLLLRIDGETPVQVMALPTTMRVQSQRHQVDATFDAKVVVQRSGQELEEHRLRCEYHYAI